MEPERWLLLRALFDRARKLAPEARREFLDRELASDPELRAQLGAVLEADGGATGFLEASGRSGSAGQPLPADLPEPEGAVVGPYRLIKVLGEGGFGVVYMAEQSRPIQRQVAVKILKRGVDSQQAAERFRAEIQALALMKHPNIAQVFDAGETPDGRPYLVMEYVPGTPITQFCDRERLTVRERCGLFLELCDAVQHAHQKGFIHRDLKPSNVLVYGGEGNPVVKVIDFGGVRAANPEEGNPAFQTREGFILGTLGYMSPEQTGFDRRAVDTRSDIYSLGILLYELLVGEIPFERKQLESAAWLEALRIIREKDPPCPSAQLEARRETAEQVARSRHADKRSLLRQIRRDLEWITLRAIEKEPERRYASVSEFAADLRRYLGHEPVLAGPPSAIYRIGKFARRHRLGVTAGMVVVAAILAGGIVAGIGLERARKAERDALREAESARRVADFLTGIFETPTPDRSLGETVTARTLLAQGARRIEGELTEDPLIRARLLNALGRAHLKLGLTDEGLPLVRNSLEIAEKSLGPDDPVVGDYLGDLADALRQAGKQDSMLPLIDRSIEIYRKLGTGRTGNLAAALHRKALWLWDQGMPGAADSLLARAIELGRTAVPPDTVMLASMYNTRGGIARRLDRPEQSAEMFQHGLDLMEKLRGKAQTLVVVLERNLAVQYLDLHETDKAIPLARDALRLARTILPPEHPTLATVLEAQATVLQQEDKPDSAGALLEEGLRILEKSYGPDHQEVVWQRYNLATFYEHSGHLDRAIARMDEAYASASRIWGLENDQTAEFLADLAAFCSEDGQERRADSLFTIAVPMVERVCRARPNFLAMTDLAYGDLCRKRSRLAQAESLYGRAEALFDSSNTMYRPFLGACRVHRALLLAREGRGPEADALARRGLAAQEMYGTDVPDLVDCLLETAVVHVLGQDKQGAMALLLEARRRGATARQESRFSVLSQLGPSNRARLPREHLGK